NSWKKIRKKKIKETIIRNFVLDMKKERTLTDDQTVQLIKLIKLGFMFGWIDGDNVKYEQGKILKIRGLRFIKETGLFEFKEPKIIAKKYVAPKGIKMSNLWKKNIENPRNRY